MCRPTSRTWRRSRSSPGGRWTAFGRVDIALLNAGVSGADNLLDPDLDAWRTQVDVNLFGLLHGIKAFVPRMLAQGSPAAVYATSSGAGVHGTTYKTAPYATTKSAQLTIMESLYGQVRDAGAPLTVGIVLPPLTRTNLVGDDLSVWDHVQRMLGGADGEAALIEPEEFAPVVVDGIEAGRFWIEASEADDAAYFGGRYGERDPPQPSPDQGEVRGPRPPRAARPLPVVSGPSLRTRGDFSSDP